MCHKVTDDEVRNDVKGSDGEVKFQAKGPESSMSKF